MQYLLIKDWEAVFLLKAFWQIGGEGKKEEKEESRPRLT